MTWLGEMSHVLRKDLREFRLLLAFYVAIVAVATGHAVGVPLLEHGAFGPSMVFVTVVGILLVASVVQSDSPTRPDAFWATHPFRRPAMLGEKVAFALLVVAIASIGQGIAVASYDVSGRTVASLVLGPAGVFGACLLCAMLLAALTRNLSAFVLGIIGILLVVFILDGTLDQRFVRLGAVQPIAQIVGFLGIAALVVWLYLRRDDRARVRVLGFAVVAVTLLSTCTSGPKPRVESTAAVRSPVVVTLEPVVRPGRPAPVGELELVVRAHGLEDGTSGEVVMRGLDLLLRDGSRLRLPMDRERLPLGLWPFAPGPPSMPGVRWLSGPPRREAQTTIMPSLTREQRERIASGVASAVLDAEVALWDTRTDASLPVVPGASLTRDGRRIRVVEVTPGNPLSTLTLDVRRIERYGDGLPMEAMGSDVTGVALVNARRGEAVLMMRTSASSGLDGLVLPGTPFRAEVARYGLQRSFARGAVEPALPDAAWLGEARLQLISNSYRGTYPIRVPLGAPRSGNDTIPMRARTSTPAAVILAR